MPQTRIAILASGEGTTAESFIRASATGKISAKVVIVISNNKTAGVFKRIDKLNKRYDLHIKTLAVNSVTHPAKDKEHLSPGEQTQDEEQAIIEALNKEKIDLVILMGYMKRVGSKLVSNFGWQTDYTSPYQAKMLNTHPGLLPATTGLYGSFVQEFVLDSKLPHGGQTLHVVSENYDEGPRIAEHKVAVKPNDSAKSLFERVKRAEKRYLPHDIARFLSAQEMYQKETGSN